MQKVKLKTVFILFAIQGSGNSSAGGNPGIFVLAGLLVLQKEERLQNNQGETIIIIFIIIIMSPLFISHFIPAMKVG